MTAPDDDAAPIPPPDGPETPGGAAEAVPPAHHRHRAPDPTGPTTGPGPGPHRLLRRLKAPPVPGGLVVGGVFWLASLRPSLLPRTAVTQGTISALSFLIGYGIGVLAVVVYERLIAHRLVPRLQDRPPTAWQRWRWRVLAGAAVVLVPVGLWAWHVTQDDQQLLVGGQPTGLLTIVPMLGVTLAVTAVLGLLSRLIGGGVVALDRWLTGRLPRWVAFTATAVIVSVLTVVLTRDVVLRRILDSVNDSFAAGNLTTTPGTNQPTVATSSGGPGSLAAWDTLGMEGRNFAGQATSTDTIGRFWGPDVPVQAPIRAYAGLRSAPTDRERADLVVRELERTGAFQREVLVVATTTGTGWVDPVASEALEVMHKGDTAIAAMQYSYLPSWISFLVDKDKASASGTALLEAVRARWEQEPAAGRAKLIVYGLSLGSFGSESSVAAGDVTASLDRAEGAGDGVLWMGPTDADPVHQQVLAARDPGSPAWRPVYQGGERVRFHVVDGDLDPEAPGWRAPRVLWVQHASDPVGWWNVPTLWAPPEWATEPRGPDVPSSSGWFPIVTWIQEVFDLMAGFSTAPGHGHNYDDAVATSWWATTAPADWSVARNEQLQRLVTS